MKIKTLLAALFLFVPFAHPGEGEASDIRVPDAAKGIIFSAPQAGFDLADLDVRDAQNRPINTVAAQAELRQLFLQNLIELVASSDPHNLRQAWSTIETLSRLFHHAILSAARPAFRLLCEAINPSNKRVVHNVHNLWITISVGSFLPGATLAHFLQQHAPRSLTLRC